MKTFRRAFATGIIFLTNAVCQFPAVGQDAAVVAGGPAVQEMRTWTDSEGRTVRASLEGLKDSETLLLRLEDGRSVPYPIQKLSAADVKYAREAVAVGGTDVTIDWQNPKQSESFVIRGVSRENAPGFVSSKSGWVYRGKCIEAKVQYKGPDKYASGNVRAYFYDRGGKLLETVAEPPKRQDENRQYVEAPDSFPAGDTIEVYFPLTAFLEESDWATVLIAFGSGSDYSVKTMPSSSYEALSFEEKQYVFPGWTPDKAASKATAGDSVEVELEIRRLHQETYDYSIVADGDYRRGIKCMAAEVRVKGDITPGDGTAKLYVYDERGKLVGSRSKPSTAQRKDGTYLGIPRIADENWYPVYFSLDGDLKDKKHPTFVAVFQFAGKTTAVVESSTGATLESLDYPEKEKP